MNEFNEKEFLEMCDKLKTNPKVEEIILNYERESYFNKMKNAVETDRRGEVVFCVIRPNGSIIAVTCEDYPKGIFRIPTGGIGHEEDIIEAVYREAIEELGLETSIIAFGGALKVKFVHEDEWFMFYSYIFVLKEKSGRLLRDATDMEVSEIKELDLIGLELLVKSLGELNESWRDWGRFRQITSGAALKLLQDIR